MALLITLLALVLISGLILFFLSSAVLERQISFGSSGQDRAEILAKTALDTTVGDLVSEIEAGSTTYITNAVPIYIPTTNWMAVPCRTVGSALTNLITVSQGGTNFWFSSATQPFSPATGPMRAGTDTHFLTTAPSLYGRYVAASSWIKPDLLDASVVSQFPTPSWILITRQGPVTNAAALPSVSTMASNSPVNMNYVVGRYAYAIYDEGGLIDVNAAGNGLPAASNIRRGRLQEAALGQLPLVDATQGDANNTAAATNIVNWRSSYGQTDSNWLFNATNTFLSVDANPLATKEQAFATRQDLIQFFQSGYTNFYPTYAGHPLLTNSLQYLTTFTRELNAPSYTPSASRALVQSAVANSTNVGNPNTFGYDNSFNPSLINVRDSNGQPVFKQRFCLGRLTWITSTGPNTNLPITAPPYPTGNAANDIKTYFGLAWDSTNNQWVYTSPEGTGLTATNIIQFPSTIPSARALTTGPDFFETLQAAIDVGSLGRDSGTAGKKDQWGGSASATGIPNVQNGVESLVQNNDQNVYQHVLQIGANIIDQTTTDSYPTAIMMGTSSGTTTVYGIKNLPYPLREFPVAVQHVDPVTPSNGAMQVWLQVQMWNPHQQGALTPSASTYPTAFRVRDDPNAPSTLQVGFFQKSQVGTAYTLASSGALTFNAAPGTFTNPTLISTNNISSPDSSTNNKGNVYAYDLSTYPPGWNYLPGTNYIYGLYCGSYSGYPPGSSTELYPAAAGTGTSLLFEYQKAGNWYPYAKTRYVQYRGYIQFPLVDNYPTSAIQCGPDHSVWAYKTNTGGTNDNGDAYWGEHQTDLHFDPRTDRFGTMGEVALGYNSTTGFNTNTPRPNGSFGNGANGDGAESYQPDSSAFVIPTTTGTGGSGGLYWGWPETLSDNVTNKFVLVNGAYTNQNEYYYDPDGIVRPAAGAYETTAAVTATSGRPMNVTDSTPTSRPIILNRPFDSVGELGYTFRDVPWKSLDFFTTNSGDAALIDVFSIDDTTAAVTAGATPVVAGKINLNTRNTYVLDAMFSGALLDEPSSAILVTSPINEVTGFARALVTRTTSTAAGMGPLANKAELVSKFSGDLNGYFNPSSDQNIEIRREAAIRGLADVGNVRTWNLMIDIIVQSGRYAATATSYQNFVVEGEKHYWLHVAIDRYTGAVVDEVLEPVYD